MREIDPAPGRPEAAPAHFKVMLALIWSTFAFDVLGILLIGFGSEMPPGFFIGATCMLSLRAWVQVSLGDRKRWARIASMILAVIGIVSLIAGGLGDFFAVLALVAAGSLLYLLSSEDVRAWCDR
jgi:hypothetical protein